ncbi:hypothetical protein VNO77_02756 [Canavalia gladiata]|uniref:Uncharacterized protein n=1 Tax=Canavalia gladiata TaxID=3824 RepID=A0AAN9MU76_CANGL
MFPGSINSCIYFADLFFVQVSPTTIFSSPPSWFLYNELNSTLGLEGTNNPTYHWKTPGQVVSPVSDFSLLLQLTLFHHIFAAIPMFGPILAWDTKTNLSLIVAFNISCCAFYPMFGMVWMQLTLSVFVPTWIAALGSDCLVRLCSCIVVYYSLFLAQAVDQANSFQTFSVLSSTSDLAAHHSVHLLIIGCFLLIHLLLFWSASFQLSFSMFSPAIFLMPHFAVLSLQHCGAMQKRISNFPKSHFRETLQPSYMLNYIISDEDPSIYPANENFALHPPIDSVMHVPLLLPVLAPASFQFSIFQSACMKLLPAVFGYGSGLTKLAETSMAIIDPSIAIRQIGVWWWG